MSEFWKLFIDDERVPNDVTWGASYKENEDYRDGTWVIARDWAEVFELISTFGMPNVISFDHDLGKNKLTGYEITKHLCNLDMDASDKYSFPSDFSFLIHSKNPVGAENIRTYLENYLNFRKEI